MPASWPTSRLVSWRVSIQSRQVSPVELVEASLARIGAQNDKINAFVYLNADYALGQAKVVEAALLRGEELGPLRACPPRSRT